MHKSDDHLIERLRVSDVEAFRLLFEKYQPILFRTLLHSLRDADAAHDIVQETFLRVWNHRTSLQPQRSFLAYVVRISTNLVRDDAKHQAVRRKYDSMIPFSSKSAGDDPENSLQLSILEERLSEVVRKDLPAKCREIFLLSRMEGMTNKEISELLNLSLKTVENQITNALKILRKNLKRYL